MKNYILQLFSNRDKNKISKIVYTFGKLKSDDFQFYFIEKYFLKKDNKECFQVLSNKTCNDLDFEELFMFLDRTTSKVGQQCLYNKIRAIPNGINDIEIKENLIKELTKNKYLRDKIQLKLHKLSNNKAFSISSLFQNKHPSPPKWFFIVKLLAFISFLLILTTVLYNFKIIIVFVGVFIVNMGIHYWNKRYLYQYVNSIPQLLILNDIANSFQKDTFFKDIINSELEHSIRIINQIRNGMSFFRLEASLQSDASSIFWSILELFKIAFLLEPIILFSILKRLETKKKEIEDVFCFVGEIDVLISIASLRFGLNTYCRPSIINSSKIIAKNIYHPLIPNSIPNSISILNKSILLTGSNMSGKTSFIRTIGLNMITGLTINTCFAESILIPKLRIYSAIRISDDLMNNKSYYFEEVLTIKKMIEKSTARSSNLFLLDEIFKGTNTIERISAGKAVLSTLSKNNNIVLVSTHDIELTDMLSEEYELYHFSEIVKNNNVDFDYKLKEGKLTKRNAIRILQINNYPKDLIAEAIKISRLLDEYYINKLKFK